MIKLIVFVLTIIYLNKIEAIFDGDTVDWNRHAYLVKVSYYF